ncbi:hypothetical protein CALVIDRAFT_537258 [Calocera viscosa TUFC12733]|uniref:Hsp90 chaperone protein kinase-targeting subunit n=1 Tax=Calocera viscosa (strain TUFC12733) TaxID=1330018 RepID=A0A167MA01_CALVF|nr:hypothetical protein CALVIDRAFT_537258 [Calocera viscosa TUFC12733]
MPLNYSKWDKLELSDDSDIEGHPNVDKRSLIRWKQRDIHEKREARKHKMDELSEEIKTSNILLPRIASLISAVSTNGPKEFSTLTERLKTQPSPDGPAPFPGAPKAPSYDEMILQLLYKVWEDVRQGEGMDVNKDEQKLEKALVKELTGHEKKLGERVKECETELKTLEAEAHAKITSEDIHEGYDSTLVPHKAEEVQIAPSASVPKHKKVHKAAETTFETLNTPTPKATPVELAKEPAPKAETSGYEPEETSGYEPDEPDDDDLDDDDEEDLPTITPALLQFSHIGVGKFQESYHFLQKNQSVLGPGSMDALYLAAYQAAMKKDFKYSKGCVHQALLLRYCEELGKDGVAMFFQKWVAVLRVTCGSFTHCRMLTGNAKAQAAFMKDVNDTSNIVKERASATRDEESEGRETIQLHVENGVSSISFNIPEGPPPPDDMPLEVSFEGGEEDEQPDLAEVRAFLKRRWDIWQGFTPKLRKALESKSLDRVNKVLEGMSVEQAEQVVAEMQESGILNFSEEGIRDETPAGKAAREAAA